MKFKTHGKQLCCLQDNKLSCHLALFSAGCHLSRPVRNRMQHGVRIHLGNPARRYRQLDLVCHIDVPALHGGSHDKPLQGILSPEFYHLWENSDLSLRRLLSRKNPAASEQECKAGESEEQE